ncbi:MAG: hypothetical protein J1E64_06915 [Acetatifactor sp.]|nr:hypothetical protein [Acetatifactor sp.]
MAVNINQDYNVYQNSYYKKTGQTEKSNTQKTGKAKGADKTSQTPQLSAKAKALLEELKAKYGNVDIMVADYETEEEAQSILSRGTKQYSALFDPETLESMAADENVKNEYMGKLEDAVSQLHEMVEQLGDKAGEVKHLGVSFGNDGSVSFFAELEKTTEKQRERIEQAREDKKEQAAKDKKAAEEERFVKGHETYKSTRVQADSMEELLEKIRSVDWDNIKATELPERGGRFDLTI